MVKVVGVSFKPKGKIYNFLPSDSELNIGDNVIVETERGIQFATITTKIKEVDESSVVAPLNTVIRKATIDDIKKNSKNKDDAQKALQKCRSLVEKYELNMYIIDASYTHDRNQLFFRFMSDNRVDFRQLAKDLGSIFKTRIELRQVGIRDKAKEIGGFGPCGRKLCCNNFLTEFDSVSINMAKNQNLSLNPTKINGVCGRLLCCLDYENDVYTELKKDLPKIGMVADTPLGMGKVVSVDVFKKTYSVDLKEKGIVEFSKDEKNGSTK